MDPRARRTRDALLAAAETLFADRAADDVTVEELAAAAGTSVGSIYNHFGSKAGLHAMVVEQALDVDEMFMDRAYTPGRSATDQIRAAAAEYVEFALTHPEHFRMLASPPPPGQYDAAERTAELLAARVAEQNQRLAAAIEEGVRSGELREIDPHHAATALWAAWNGIIALSWRHDSLRLERDELARVAQVAAELVELGLLARDLPA